jgi:hypothetical protein
MRLFLGKSTPAIRAMRFGPSTLPLFVARILALDPHDALSADHFAVLADLLDGCANFHLRLTSADR